MVTEKPEPIPAATEADLLHRLETSLVKRILRRFWIGAIIVPFLGYFGIKEIVRSVTDSEIRAAQRAAVVAEEAAKKATAVTEEAVKQTENYSKTVGVLQNEAKKVDAQFLEVKQRLDSESANLRAASEKTARDLVTRVARLEELVVRIAQESQASRQALETYKRDLDKLKLAAEAEQRRFAANSQYSVILYFLERTKDLAQKAQEKLAQEGFRTSITDLNQWQKISLVFATMRTTAPTVNTITYSAGATAKATEIKGLLAPIARIETVVEGDTRRTPVGREPEMTWVWIPHVTNQISVYLVEK